MLAVTRRAWLLWFWAPFGVTLLLVLLFVWFTQPGPDPFQGF